MEFEFKEVVLVLSTILGPTGAAWVAVKGSLNGTKRRIERIENKVDKIENMMMDQNKFCQSQVREFEHRITLAEK